MRFSEAFAALVDLAVARGHRDLAKHDGLLHLDIDSAWSADINGHSRTVDNVPLYHARLTFNGWPAGIIGPSDGIIAEGAAANEDAFILACRAAAEAAS